MADTQRTTAALLVLLADNTTGAITPQHLRDVLVSLQGGYGGLCAAVAAGALSVGVAAVKITGWDTLQTQDSTAVAGSLADDDLDVTIAGVYAVDASVSVSGTADANSLRLHERFVFDNGERQERTWVLTRSGDGNFR